MPSGYTSNLPNDVLLDNALLYIGSVLWGASTDGLKWDPGTTYRNVPFAGARTPIAGLDRVIRRAPKFTGTFLEFGPTQIPHLHDEVVGVVAGGTTTYTPPLASGLLASGSYVTDVSIVFRRGGGGYAVVRFAIARIMYGALSGAVDAEGTYDLTVEARSAAASSTDAPPYVVELYAPGSVPEGVGAPTDNVIAEVIVSPSNAGTIAGGATQQFTAVARNAAHVPVSPQPAQTDYTWSVVDPADGTVSTSGLFTAAAAGSSDNPFAVRAQISSTFGSGGGVIGGGSGAAVASVTWLEGNTASPQVGAGTVTRTAVVKDASNNPLSGRTVTFNNPNVAHFTRAPASGTTDASGYVAVVLTPVAAGGPDNLVATCETVNSPNCAVTTLAASSDLLLANFTGTSGAALDGSYHAETGQVFVPVGDAVFKFFTEAGKSYGYADSGTPYVTGYFDVGGGLVSMNSKTVEALMGSLPLGAFFGIAIRGGAGGSIAYVGGLRNGGGNAIPVYATSAEAAAGSGTDITSSIATPVSGDTVQLVFSADGNMVTIKINGTVVGYGDLTVGRYAGNPTLNTDGPRVGFSIVYTGLDGGSGRPKFGLDKLRVF